MQFFGDLPVRTAVALHHYHGPLLAGQTVDGLAQTPVDIAAFDILGQRVVLLLAELGDAVLIYTEKAKRENIHIIYQEPEMLPFVYGDKNRIRQVFINVIDNAIKYSDPGSTITVSAEEVGNMIQVTITDNGVGISAADLPRVKTKFFKANHTRRGSGIGLAVADEIITMHGGRLDITSELNVGTNVTITLPVEAQRRSSAAT